jgi:hypothetical protein
MAADGILAAYCAVVQNSSDNGADEREAASRAGLAPVPCSQHSGGHL